MRFKQLATALSILALAGTGMPAYAEVFKSAEFLKWKPKSQAFYIEASVGMASLIAAQNDKKQATCIDDWYYENEEKANTFILDTMKAHSSYHPRGIILGAISKKCGDLKYPR